MLAARGVVQQPHHVTHLSGVLPRASEGYLLVRHVPYAVGVTFQSPGSATPRSGGAQPWVGDPTMCVYAEGVTQIATSTINSTRNVRRSQCRICDTNAEIRLGTSPFYDVPLGWQCIVCDLRHHQRWAPANRGCGTIRPGRRGVSRGSHGPKGMACGVWSRTQGACRVAPGIAASVVLPLCNAFGVWLRRGDRYYGI